jgi:DHA2 family multidrug resistance protein
VTKVVATGVAQERPSVGGLLVGGIVLAALTEAIASTLLSLGRQDIIGDTSATPDEFAWLDVGYTALKLMGFALSPWLLTRASPRACLLVATLAMGAACGLAAVVTSLEILIVLRLIQGLAGAVLLVSGQTMLFRDFPRDFQPLLQAVFAMGSVVAPATLAPVLEGWLIDSHSWTWIFFLVSPIALTAAALIILDDTPASTVDAPRPFDGLGVALLSVALVSVSYVLVRGARWDWFESDHILWLSILATSAFAAFCLRRQSAHRRKVFDLSVFRVGDFSFAFVVSFVAGAALFGSAFLIPAFATSALAFTPTAAGWLLLPSGGLFICSLFLAAFLIQKRRAPPIATVPFGILAIMVSMWMLAQSTLESGADDMMLAILLRGLGLGFLFLSITLIAFDGLPPRSVASGIAVFNIGRQLGGLMGVAGLQTLIDHQIVANTSVLGANLSPGLSVVNERIASTTAALVARGMDPAIAASNATSMLGRAVTGQASAIAFNTAFFAIALLFVVAAPIIVAIKITIARHARQRAA